MSEDLEKQSTDEGQNKDLNKQGSDLIAEINKRAEAEQASLEAENLCNQPKTSEVVLENTQENRGRTVFENQRQNALEAEATNSHSATSVGDINLVAIEASANKNSKTKEPLKGPDDMPVGSDLTPDSIKESKANSQEPAENQSDKDNRTDIEKTVDDIKAQQAAEQAARDNGEGGSMSLIEHLEELRWRIIKSLIAVGVGSIIAYFFLDDIMKFITEPAGKLYYMQPAEAFFTYIKVTIFCGFLIALPVIFYQIWVFFLPALKKGERMVLGLLVPISVVLFFGGLAFSFFLVLPTAIKFFMGIGTDTLAPMFSVEKYFDFALAFILPFGLVFELPLAIIMLAKLGIVGSKKLQSMFRYVIFLSFVVGAVISPTPDIFTQSMIAVPMILLYGISLFVVKFIMEK